MADSGPTPRIPPNVLKAVTARVRDAIGRLATGAPLLAAHLDRSTRTGLHCSYVPLGEDADILWNVRN
ncbi:MAG: hypothetical protein KY461_01140 [Actinobacteria bacterium]|nr:hypothetical protein [Actinomycetota bacterium]